MTKADFINAVHDATGAASKKDTAASVQAVFDALSGAIQAGGRFGTFKVKERASRQGRNPKTGTAIEIAASKTVGFKPSANFKDAL